MANPPRKTRNTPSKKYSPSDYRKKQAREGGPTPGRKSRKPPASTTKPKPVDKEKRAQNKASKNKAARSASPDSDTLSGNNLVIGDEVVLDLNSQAKATASVDSQSANTSLLQDPAKATASEDSQSANTSLLQDPAKEAPSEDSQSANTSPLQDSANTRHENTSLAIKKTKTGKRKGPRGLYAGLDTYGTGEWTRGKPPYARRNGKVDPRKTYFKTISQVFDKSQDEWGMYFEVHLEGEHSLKKDHVEFYDLQRFDKGFLKFAEWVHHKKTPLSKRNYFTDAKSKGYLFYCHVMDKLRAEENLERERIETNKMLESMGASLI